MIRTVLVVAIVKGVVGVAHKRKKNKLFYLKLLFFRGIFMFLSWYFFRGTIKILRKWV